MPKKTAPKAKPKSVAAAAKKPLTKPVAKPTVKSAAKPVAKAAAKSAGRPAPRGVVAPAPSKPAIAAVTTPAAKAAPKMAPKGSTLSVASQPSKAPSPPSGKTTSKPVPPEAKSDAKSKGPALKPSSVAKPAAVEDAPESVADGIDPKTGRKGITVVPSKAAKKPIVKVPAHSLIPVSVGRLLDPKNPIRRPLIPSGPKAANVRPLGSQSGREAGPELPKPKSPFNKKELEHYRVKLVKKRAELVGDVATMESEALRGQSGALSDLPQHMADQGSEAYDQSLSLDLAAADRKLIKEIDDALNRIADGSFGMCVLTGRPIGIERLEELPWAALSIEAARSLERPMGRI